MPTAARSTASLLALLGLLASSAFAHAQGAATALEVSTVPALPIAANAGAAKVRAVSAGSSVALRVTATFADGTRRDVTSDPATSYQSLAPGVASVSTTGELRFASGSQADAAAILVEHGAASALVAFDVVP